MIPSINEPRQDALDNVTRFEYDGDGNLIRQIDPEGAAIRSSYDQDGNLVKTVDGAGNEITNLYERAGSSCPSCTLVKQSQPTKTIFPTYAKEYGYDKRGRKTSETDLLGASETTVTQFAYDGAGNLTGKTDREGKLTAYEYDSLNRLGRVIDPLNQATIYAYDTRDNLISLTDAKGNTTRFAYDRSNRLIGETRPLGQTTSYQYDGAGRLAQKTDAKAQRIGYSYDDAGRLIGITYYDASGSLVKTVTLAYDTRGNLLSSSDGSTSASYSYDDLNRKTAETVNYGPFSLTTGYGYTKNGSKKGFTYPDGTMISYSYDAANRFVGMQVPNAGFVTVSGYQWSRPAGLTLPGGGTRQFSYDPLMRTKTIAAANPGQSPIQGYQYNYDRMDNITQKETEHGSYGYAYDELYRLIQADNANQVSESYSYDQVGNRLTSGEASDWTYNANNELTAYDGVTYQYDANGNTIQKTQAGQITKYFYDVDNRLIRVEDGAGTIIAVYSYDPFGRRIAKTAGGATTYYLYSDEELIGEYDSTGAAIKTYGYRPDSTWGTDPVFMKQGGEHYFYHTDHLGTPQKMTAASGAVVWSATYDAFGKATIDASSTVTNNLRFPGQYYDQETGLHYNFHRYYDPGTGRYVTVDPIGLLVKEDSNEEINHLYSYVSNNPLSLSDPLGLVFYGKYCGAGGSGTPTNCVDRACKKHDECYEKCRLNASTRFLPKNLRKKCPWDCDKQLVSDVGQCCQ